MDSGNILDLYEWAPGACFRCARSGVDTAVVGLLRPPEGAPQEVRACYSCLLRLESEKEDAAKRADLPYTPGQLGSRNCQ
jgi:hypothetical protein